MSKIVIAGASGVVGSAALERFLERDGWEAVALSRRRPDIDAARDFDHVPVDLRDAGASRQVLGELEGVTHLLYTAVFEKPGLIAGWSEEDQMQTNLEMLENCLAPLLEKGTLEQVTILQGTKAYGIHLHPMPVPARERYPRDDHPNFYWLQEDYLKEQAEKHGFRWSILRPQLIIGSTIGAVMNLAPVIGAYAAIRKERSEPFSFPGGISYVWELVDSRVCAAAAEFCATDPKADGQHYNVTNGEVFEWRNLWPALADQLGVETGPDEPIAMAEFFPANEETWEKVVQSNGLRPNSLSDILGESHYYADFCFAYGAEEPPPPAFVSAIKLRKDGVCETYDSEETFRHWIGWLQDRKILPAA
ncbi:MAG TPA: SDR family oxidoreductase [Solirubrobacterales bacterium]|nr:SDR family oxidoreductase [Solirubrobacterales bacterium]